MNHTHNHLEKTVSDQWFLLNVSLVIYSSWKVPGVVSTITTTLIKSNSQLIFVHSTPTSLDLLVWSSVHILSNTTFSLPTVQVDMVCNMLLPLVGLFPSTWRTLNINRSIWLALVFNASSTIRRSSSQWLSETCTRTHTRRWAVIFDSFFCG